jgi:hypothetical protein
MATTSLDAQTPFSSVNFDRPNRQIILAVKLALANSIKPELCELLVRVVYSNGELDEHNFSRQDIKAIIAKNATSPNFELVVAAKYFGLGAQVQLVEHVNDNGTIKALSPSTRDLRILERPVAPLLELHEKGTFIANVDPTKLNVSLVKLKVYVNGSNGGAKLTKMSVLYHIINSDGSISGPQFVVQDRNITAPELLAGHAIINVSQIDAVETDSIIRFAASVENGSDESLLSKAVALRVSNKPLKPLLIHVVSGLKSKNANKLKTTIVGKLNKEDDPKLWKFLWVQYSLDGTTWANHLSSFEQKTILSQLEENDTFKLDIDNLLSDVDAKKALTFRLLLSNSSSSPAIAQLEAANEVRSDEGTAVLGYSDSPANATTAALSLVPSGIGASAVIIPTLTLTHGANFTQLFAVSTRVELMIDGKVHQVRDFFTHVGAQLPSTLTFDQIAVNQVSRETKFSAKATLSSPLAPQQIAAWLHPSLSTDSSGRPALGLREVTSPASYRPVNENEVPPPENVSLSAIQTGGVQGILAAFSIAASENDNYTTTDVDAEVARSSDFGTPLALGGSGTTLSTRYSMPYLATNDGSDYMLLKLHALVGSPTAVATAVDFTAGSRVWLRIRQRGTSSGTQVTGAWKVVMFEFPPARLPVGPSGLSLNKVDEETLSAQFNQLPKNINYAGFIKSNEATLVKYRAIIKDENGYPIYTQELVYDSTVSVGDPVKFIANKIPSGQNVNLNVHAVYVNKEGEQTPSEVSFTAVDFVFYKSPKITNVEVVVDDKIRITAEASIFNVPAGQTTVTAIVPHKNNQGNLELLATMNTTDNKTWVIVLDKTSDNQQVTAAAIIIVNRAGWFHLTWP